MWSVVGECCSALRAHSHRAVFRSVFSPQLSYQAAAPGTKRPFTLTLTRCHPHHHRNQRRGIHSSPLISISPYPLADGPSSGLR